MPLPELVRIAHAHGIVAIDDLGAGPLLDFSRFGFAQAIRERTSGVIVGTTEGFSQMGSGSLPTQNLPTRLVVVRSESVGAGKLASMLRRHTPPVFARVYKGHVLVDPRALLEGEEQPLVDAFVLALQQ